MKPLCCLVLVTLSACSMDPDLDSISEESRHHDGAPVFRPSAHPYGKSMTRWAQRWWKWTFSIPAEENPFFDESGENCAVGQDGVVWFLASIADPGGQSSFTRSCTIPAGKAILVTPATFLNDYPCPDPNFEPAPGQSLFDFLSEGAAAVIDQDTIGVTIDGEEVEDPFDFRSASRHLFSITGHPSLRTTLDGCITGSPQPAVTDGYFYMVKPLPPGEHTIVVRSMDTSGTDLTLTWDLTIAGH